MKNIFLSILFFLVLMSFKGTPSNLSQTKFNKTSLDRETRTIMNISNISSWLRYDGQSAHDPNGSSGGFYPRGKVSTIYQDGFIWGGFVDGDTLPRVGGQTYSLGTQAGRIIATGIPADPDDYRVQIYRIRSDWENLSIGDSIVIMDAAEINLTDTANVTLQMQQDVIDQYKYDWENWPGDLGAPYYDLNENGVWDSGIDEPGLADANMVIWFVINDLDIGRTLSLYGSEPIGLEVQITFWGYNETIDGVDQAIFQRYRIINKSGMEIDSMFVSRWSDPDLGVHANDFAACDTALNFGYIYNSSNEDDDFQAFGLVPAAVGYVLLQGPVVMGIEGQDLNQNGVNDAQERAIFDFKYSNQGYINLPLTSFYFFAAGSPIDDPPFGEYDGTLEWYNMLNGFTPNASDTLFPYITGYGPNQGEPTKFPLNGDPVTGVGDIDGLGNNLSPGDRRMGLCSGPFNMQPGDVQEIIVALVGGIGTDYLNSISVLKENVSATVDKYDSLKVIEKIVVAPPKNINIQLTSDLYVQLSWDANSELDFDHYNILRSLDGLSYDSIGVTTEVTYVDSIVSPGENYYYAIVAVDSSGIISDYSSIVSILVTGINDKNLNPVSYNLAQNYPNPFNPSTTIQYDLAVAGQVEITVFNILGKKVTTLANEYKEAGSYQVKWDANGLCSGLYFYRIKAANFNEIKKAVFMK